MQVSTPARPAVAATADAPNSPSRPRRDRRPLLLVAAVSVAITLHEARFPFDSDAWWHMKSGDLILDAGALPREDPFAWTAAGRPWPINSWLYDVLAAILRAAGGTRLVTLVLLVAAGAFAFAAYLLARNAGARPWPSAVAAAAAQWVMAEHIAERPQILSYLLFAGALVLADRALRGSNRATVGLAALVVPWANLHLAFSLGVGIIALLALGRAIHERQWRRPAVVAGAAVLAGLCTPFGIGGYTAALAARDTSGVIQEWRHIDLTRPHDLGVVLVMLLTLVAMTRTGRWRRLDCLLPVCALIALTVDSMRQEAFLALIIAPELALGLSSFPVKTLRGRNLMRARALWHGAIVGFAIVCAMSLVDVTRFRGTPATFYPVDATAAIPDGCRLLNEYVFGGYITDERWPDLLVSQDGRNPLEQDFERQEEVLDGRAGSVEWIDDHAVDCVLARPERPLVDRLRDEGWSVRARDPSGVLLVRPGQRPLPLGSA